MADRRTRSATAATVVGTLLLVTTGAGCGPPPGGPGRPPITVTHLLGPDGTPLGAAHFVNEAGQVLAQGTETYLWEDGSTTLVTAVSEWGSANDMSEQGQVVGTTGTPNPVSGGITAFSWQDGTWTELDGSIVAEDVNDRGQILGKGAPAGGRVGTVVWDHAQQEIEDAFRTGDAEPIDINNRGQALLDIGAPSEKQAAVWQIGGEVTLLGTLDGVRSRGRDINDAGDVTGAVTDAAGNSRAFLWRDGRMIDLGTLGGATSVGMAINDAGQVVGHAEDAQGRGHAVLWEDGRIVDLGTLGGHRASAVGLNERGQVIGWSTIDPGDDQRQHVFLWEDGQMTDLSDLVAADSTAGWVADINDRGQIVGWVEDPQLGDYRAVLWTAPPRP